MFKKLKRFFFGNNISSRVQDAEIERGFRALKTAGHLVRLSEQGKFFPRGVIVEIGDGFYVEKMENGELKKMVWDDAFGVYQILTSASLTLYSAKIDCYAEKVRRYANIAEQAGFTKDHPFVKSIGDFRIDIPKPEIPPIPLIPLIPK